MRFPFSNYIAGKKLLTHISGTFLFLRIFINYVKNWSSLLQSTFLKMSAAKPQRNLTKKFEFDGKGPGFSGIANYRLFPRNISESFLHYGMVSLIQITNEKRGLDQRVIPARL